MKGREIFVPKIPSYRLLDLVKAFSNKPKINIIGTRPGEKVHEEMVIYDSPNTLECNIFVIYPNALEKQKERKRLKGKTNQILVIQVIKITFRY